MSTTVTLSELSLNEQTLTDVSVSDLLGRIFEIGIENATISEETMRMWRESNTPAETEALPEIADVKTYELRGLEVVDAKAAIKELESIYDPFTTMFHEAHKRATTTKAQATLPLVQYVDQRQKCRKAYEEERDRLAAFENQRREAEAREKQRAEAQRREDLALAEAQRLVEAGKVELADEIIEQHAAQAEQEQVNAVLTPVVQYVAPELPRTAGANKIARWKLKVESPRLLLEGLLKDPFTLDAMTPAIEAEMRKLFGVHVTRQRDAFEYPGCKAVKE